MSSNNSNLEDMKKFLNGTIQASGFSLENNLAKVLKKTYSVKREVSYHDKDEMKGRSLDILAQKFFPDENKFPQGTQRTVAQLSLVIECKNITGNIWVFSLDDDRVLRIPDFASIKFNSGDPAINVAPLNSISTIPSVSGYDEYVYDKSKSNKQTNNLYSAIMTVTKATHYLKESYDDIFSKLKNWKPTKQNYVLLMNFFQPVIVFTGHLFVTKINEKDEVEFNQVKYVQMDKNYVSKDYHELGGRIHIISYDCIIEYLQMVEPHYRSKEDFLIANQKDLLKELNLDFTSHVGGGIPKKSQRFT